jgi:chromosome segregation protein
LLKLKRVELQGFKSFCERSEMRFHGNGIAAIVGPNGCGKSNISDAISWVLGEQSAKSLRGTRMEDVIFAGTRDRKPLSMAQVTMTMVNPDYREAPPPASVAEGTDGEAKPAEPMSLAKSIGPEITVTRRLYRDGNSDYLIDGRLARLRDIQDIFSGTGLGPESYAIIEQGRIGQLLSSKPHDRRAVIEEAAGVAKFKTKRRLAEAKLENAKQNLSRVFDILEEVGRQANSLKRQASKAQKYKELHGELVVALRLALTGKFRRLERETTKIALDLNEANSAFQQVSEHVAVQENEQHHVLEQSYAVESELTATREKLSQLRLEAERTRGRIEGQARQIAGMENQLQQGEAEAQVIEGRQAQMTQDLEACSERLAELEQEAAEARGRLDEKTRERDSLQAGLRERERTIESGRQQVLRLLGEVSSLKNALAQMEGHFQSIERDRARLTREEQMAAAELERLEGRKVEVTTELSARQMELESLADQRKRVELDLTERRQMAGTARKDLDDLRAQLSHFKARRDSLEEILSHRAYTTESVKRFFTALGHGQAQNLKPIGVLADFVEADAAFEKATEEFLNEELEYVIVKDWSQAESGIDFMRTDLDGRATFLVHPEPGANVSHQPAPEPPLGPDTGIVGRLTDMMRLTNGLTQAPAALLPRLARCFMAEDRQSAQRLATQYPDYFFLLADGVCYHGHAVSGGRKTGSGPLALKRELRELTTQTSAKQRAVDETNEMLIKLERETQGLAVELETLRTRQQREEREALALDHEMRRLAEEFARANSKVSVSRLELQRLERESAKAAEQRESSLQQVSGKDAARVAQEEVLAEIREAFEEAKSQFNQASEEHSALRVAMAEREERRRSENSALERLRSAAQEFERRRAGVVAMIERIGVERTRLLNDNMQLDQTAERLATGIGSTEAQVNELAAREQELREAMAEHDESLKALRAEVQAIQERRSQSELALVERRAELKYLEETCQKEMKVSLEELAGAGDAEAVEPDETALAEAEEKYLTLKTRIENLGPVNPDALSEFEEAQQRYDFLNAQRQDLLDSIRDTEKAIQEIDVESKKRFLDAFNAINENFKAGYTKLFGGGSAEMRLTDEANANDSGIDIVASPPGKRLQNVLLLSGGEKALTALSLLMAIFQYAPSPFCILDEVDAPLDEPNIQRLMGLLREMSAHTQFIVITHAKRTMEAAQALYGVTMQEAGVSKLVSVRFNPVPGQLTTAGSGQHVVTMGRA